MQRRHRIALALGLTAVLLYVTSMLYPLIEAEEPDLKDLAKLVAEAVGYIGVVDKWLTLILTGSTPEPPEPRYELAQDLYRLASMVGEGGGHLARRLSEALESYGEGVLVASMVAGNGSTISRAIEDAKSILEELLECRAPDRDVEELEKALNILDAAVKRSVYVAPGNLLNTTHRVLIEAFIDKVYSLRESLYYTLVLAKAVEEDPSLAGLFCRDPLQVLNRLLGSKGFEALAALAALNPELSSRIISQAVSVDADAPNATGAADAGVGAGAGAAYPSSDD